MTHWWDGSQIYGNTWPSRTSCATERGRQAALWSTDCRRSPTIPAHNPTLVPGFWLGLGMMQTLFAMEHNAICDRLAAAYPGWTDEQLFQRARLITAALLAKIHTVEWTPAVTAHPTAVAALHANWYGPGRRSGCTTSSAGSAAAR